MATNGLKVSKIFKPQLSLSADKYRLLLILFDNSRACNQNSEGQTPPFCSFILSFSAFHPPNKNSTAVTHMASREHGLAPSTVYGHLFSTGTHDPHEFITQNEYDRAFRIYEDDYEQPSLELDKFLDVSAKAAFYYIRRES